MRKLLNTFFVTSEDIYLALDGENVVAKREQQVSAAYAERHHYILLCRRVSGIDGGLCGKGNWAGVL